MLGKDIVEYLLKHAHLNIYGFDKLSNHNTPFIHQIQGDLTDYVVLKKTLSEIKPEIIIHCAAIVNVDECESNKDAADEIHREVTHSERSDVVEKMGALRWIDFHVFESGLDDHFGAGDLIPSHRYSQPRIQRAPPADPD